MFNNNRTAYDLGIEDKYIRWNISDTNSYHGINFVSEHDLLTMTDELFNSTKLICLKSQKSLPFNWENLEKLRIIKDIIE